MGQIVQIGTVNVPSLNVPQVLVQIVPPQFLYGGVQTNVGGIVGTATWGPVDSPQAFGTVAQGAQIFGNTVNRLYDLMGHAGLAMAQGATFLYGVRVTDGTDLAASVVIPSTAAVAAKTTFTEATTKDFIAGDAATIGNQTFNFVSSIGSTPGNILVQADTNAGFATTMAAIIASMAASISGGPATANYVPNTTPANVSGAAGNGLTTGATYIFSALAAGTAGNSLVSTYTPAGTSAGSFGGSTFSGGAAAIVGITLTAKYTGSNGNNLQATLSSGTAANSYKLVLSLAGWPPEVYDNLTGAGNAIWTAMANGVNNGLSSTRGPSNLCTATAGAGTAAPPSIPTTYTLSGGTDGAATITSAVMIGVDTLPRSGMYCLRNTGVSKAMLADNSDSTVWSIQVAFGLSIACEMIMCSPAGDTVANAATELATAGVDNFTATCMFGDWIYFYDTYNNVPLRLISPQSCKLGILCALSPQNSALNKQIVGIVGTQKSLSGVPYTTADLQLLATARMDVIGVNPQVGTTYFACMFGVNCSSEQVIQDDSYTQLTYFIAKSLFVIGGPYVGQVQTPAEQLSALTAILQFLAFIAAPVSQGGGGMLSTISGAQPYAVVLNSTNNPPNQMALGFQNAYVQCVYGPIVRYFIFSLQGGTTVTVSTDAPNQNQTT